jgi:hypothetical protein
MEDAAADSRPPGAPRDIDSLNATRLGNLTHAYLYASDNGEPLWWLWLLPRLGSENSGRLDVGQRSEEPSRDELIGLLGARGLMPVPGGWGEWEGDLSSGRRRVAIALISTYTEHQADVATAEASRRANGTTKSAVTWALWLSGVAALLCFLSVGHFAYEFYVFLRIAIASAAVALAVLAVRRKRPAWVIIFAPIAILWNPIIPIDMTRAAWAPLDFIATAFFVWSWISWYRISAKPNPPKAL